MNKNIKNLLGDISLKCLKNKISLELIAKKHLIYNNIECSGLFDENGLKVSTDKPLEDWLIILIHESCHMDQFLEKSPYWNTEKDPLAIVDKWLNKKNINSKILKKAFQDSILLELDCEKRSVKKMKKYKLKINTSLYIQKANAYLFSYWATYKNREWFKFPYLNPKIYKKMPNKFLTEKEYLDENCKYLKLYK
jgi:hypothetical protein